MILVPAAALPQHKGPAKHKGKTYRLKTDAGSMIETQGPWQISGQRVIFTAKNGQLTSIRSSSIDWKATRDLAAENRVSTRSEARRAPTAAALVLTDEQVPDFEDDDESAQGSSGQDHALGTDHAHQVRVSEWQRISGIDGGVLITGILHNGGPAPAHRLAVAIGLVNEHRELIATESATTRSSILSAGSDTYFHAVFPSVDTKDFESASFTIVAATSP